MNKLTGFSGAALLAAAPLAFASPIYYEVEHLGGDRWQYTYTVGNDTGGDIDWFTIFFDPNFYAFDTDDFGFGEEVDPATYAGPSGWDVLVAAPDPLFGGPFDEQPGFYDAFAFGAPIAPGEQVTGFSMIFTWLGAGTPGSQPFTLYGDWLLPEFGANLFTERLGGGPVIVSESSSLGLLGASIVLFGFGRRALARG